MSYEYKSKIAQEIDVILYTKTKIILSALNENIDYMKSMFDMNSRLAKDANGYAKQIYTEVAKYYAGYVAGLERAKEIIEANMIY